MIDRQLSKTLENLASLVGSTSIEEPTRRLRLKEHAYNEQCSRSELQTEWDVPLSVGCWRYMDINTVVNPETDDLRELEKDFEYTNKTASNGWWTGLGDVDWDNH
jgi:hypothetical protein